MFRHRHRTMAWLNTFSSQSLLLVVTLLGIQQDGTGNILSIFKLLSSLLKENTIAPPFSGIHLRLFFYLGDDFELLQVLLLRLLKSNIFICEMAERLLKRSLSKMNSSFPQICYSPKSPPFWWMITYSPIASVSLAWNKAALFVSFFSLLHHLISS